MIRFAALGLANKQVSDAFKKVNVVLPEGVKLISDPKMTVVHLSVRSAEVEEVPVVAAATEGDAAAAPAEGDAAASAAAPAGGDDKKDKKK